jgi:abequosyltransferase
MSHTNGSEPSPKLSLCITTLNRAAFLRQTLSEILSQISDRCEVVVVDGASTDGTESVLQEYSKRSRALRYVKQQVNEGIDRGFDVAVESARGEFCWLMPDDDLLQPGAIARVLREIDAGPSLLLLNYERRDISMSHVVRSRCVAVESDRLYGPHEMDRLFADTGPLLIYIGSVVINRSIWIARERSRYYGSMFIHVGVIFQSPLPGNALFVADPLVSFRAGNSKSYWSRLFEILMFGWPALVWSLPVSDAAKMQVSPPEPWRSASALLWLRALGTYSLREYRRLIYPRERSVVSTLVPAIIALLPGILVNLTLVCWLEIRFHPEKRALVPMLKKSPYNLRNSWRQSAGEL